jgi:prophage regulatory protein
MPAEFQLKFLRLPQVKELTGLSRSAIYSLPDFPRPIKLGHTNASAWVESEVMDWMRRQIEKRDYAVVRPRAS